MPATPFPYLLIAIDVGAETFACYYTPNVKIFKSCVKKLLPSYVPLGNEGQENNLVTKNQGIMHESSCALLISQTIGTKVLCDRDICKIC